ncbi:DUF3800 domain-containing protein [Pelolinea submarina]|uniref:Uncharacterized protein DUF3800 n=1 Tax=Pelolinea submarina TaxID=913107 RepID=A0A3E0AB78_9CHLR|nr:DUF3800 domain-containing protein [Pelolinea submarina]REG05472.1 uncharacterized protein DUF3800 [Pelolinea submarina]
MTDIDSDSKDYFVDEAGNPEIFKKGGVSIVGQPGCSTYFILGYLEVADPRSLRERLRTLHTELLVDPYYANIPSMKINQNKTAVLFHAKDDCQEVREKVFRLLKREEGIKFVAVVKDKKKVLDYALARSKGNPTYRYNPNELYDLLTRRLFKNSLHNADVYKICYAIRGQKPRTDAFGSCLRIAQQRYLDDKGLSDCSRIEISPTFSKNEPCLQAADYFLWALQRLYEKSKIRYLEYLREHYKLVIDIDDTRKNKYGEYYSNRNPITKEKVLRD